ncbi:MAG: hypothetical protein IJY46_10555, partial [Lentisphaeria bacterium]|nr:hypothetical protein [Lentisphaeria bacterium]
MILQLSGGCCKTFVLQQPFSLTTGGGNLACFCEPFLRTSGFITLRRDKHLHTLPRRSFSGDGSLSFALKKLTLTSRY